MTDNLLPFPFCGGTDIRFVGEFDFHWHARYNADCASTGPADLGESGAIEKWNAAPRAGWQPIETAPKDGTRILMYDGEHIFIVYWKSVLGKSGYFAIAGSEDREEDDFAYMDCGTHWLPLPPPPDASRE